MRKKILKLYGTLLAVGGIYAAWLLLTDKYIPCFYLALTGHSCGGCGTTHMLISLLKLDFATAFRFNPVMFILFFVWNTIGLLCLFEKPSFIKNKIFIFSCAALSLIAVILLWIYRFFA